MKMSFRWYGESDEISLEYIRQIPGMEGIVTAIYDIPVGEVWPLEKIESLKNTVEKAGLEISVIESVPVHEDIKLGKETRDCFIANYQETIRNIGKANIPVVCYNFMPIFDWTRTDLAHPLEDGSTTLIYDEKILEKMDPLTGELSLPGWDSSYTKDDLASLFADYNNITKEDLWDNLTYFLQKVIPVAKESDVKMAIHPDDPPWDIFGLPRIITNQESLERVCQIYDSPYNGLTMCSGSLGASRDNDFPAMLDHFLAKDRVNFIHARNVKLVGKKSFEEAAHLSSKGSIDMKAAVEAMAKHNFKGAVRPDHGRNIWGEKGRPGYGLYDRALGATYLLGLWEALKKD